MQIKYESLIDSSGAYARLKSDAEGDRLSHAYLLAGGDGAGLSALTACFLRLALKDLKDSEVKLVGRVHPDVFYLPRQGSEKVLTQDIDFITETAYFTPTEGDKKFYVIERAETMTAAAQNKLLKVLEEPPRRVTLVLQCAAEQNLLPTVRSRCLRVALAPFSEQELYNELKKYYPDDKRLALAISAGRGSIEHSEKLLRTENYLKLFNLVLESLLRMKRSPDILEFASKLLIFKDDMDEAIDFYQLLLRDVLVYGSAEINCTFAGDELSGLKNDFSDEAVLKIFECLTLARRRLNLNGNISGIVDQLLFSILEVKAKCPRL